ncbi:MAG: CatB-related O-acetyltransferase [Deltaproteobacteria bacterium]|nr:CatB-related O-acetyltransferase [Candidatus Tharpella sp.]
MNFFKKLTSSKSKQKKPFSRDLINEKNIDIGAYSYGEPIIHRWSDKYRVEIGKFCSIADDVHLLVDGNHRSDWISTYPFGQLLENFPKNQEHPTGKGNIKIGNDVWIARSAVILSGVSIGNGAVIAAGAMVVKDVADYQIVGGNPAHNLGFRFSKSQIEDLLKIAWWNWPLEKVREEIALLESQNINEFIKRNI